MDDRSQSRFFALISRMKYIARWSLMRNTRTENVSEHTQEVCMLAHALAVIRREVFGKECDAGRVLELALYHDAGEIITGDLPNPIKYHNPAIIDAYKSIEREAADRLTAMLPDELKGTYETLLAPGAEDFELLKLVKAADKLSALIKCLEERHAGNAEFRAAETHIRSQIEELGLKEAAYFMEVFLPGYMLTLDEIR